ncbi:MOSC domain-containing protein [Aneurinibacillus aneurinilyticus]|uniref:MOSC domain protein n=2 Tax=Aneurinibacillus aneurinilyticus TaxID=1391 RepID=U1Y6W0_ANEAE|nr:MOSC domain protein [Aneurinibacillus aneurinilyticus ATCC 12856]
MNEMKLFIGEREDRAMDIEIKSINVGKPLTITHKGKEITTGIYKHQVDKPLFLSTLNFDGDAQADLVHHGGVDKAVCVYSYEHYAYWEKELNRELTFGAFGENLTVTGMLEDTICIGDTYQLGEAIVQISQPRQPCHKLAKKYDVIDLPIKFQNTGFTGFYFRVLKEGWVTQPVSMRLIERSPKNVTVSFANNTMHHDKQNIEAIQRILDVEELSGNWRKTFLKRLEGIEVDTSKRLTGD